MDEKTSGASFTFGCSWSPYFSTCKFARSRDPSSVRKFKLKKEDEENELSSHLGHMSTLLKPLFRSTVPDAFVNMTATEELAGVQDWL